ncbi:MAG: hypothetical protein KatS3mg129_0882 [Leptospiraceae bacterium]|nr:MAG: hypothetical protein KatS3mg129_0882 [Leptospiraceae bacterium]
MNYKEYNDFRPIEYLYQFYLKENKENVYFLNFLVDCVLDIWDHWKGEKKKIIELGGGPSLFSIIPISLVAKEIHFSDFLKVNLNIIEQWINKKEYFNWDPIIEKTLFLEQKKLNKDIETPYISQRLIEHRKEVIRRRWTKTFELDLKFFSPDVEQYDLVSSHFVPECITDNQNEFLFILQNILSFSKPEGYLLLSFFLEAKYLKIGRGIYPAYNLNYEYLKKILKHFNLDIIKIQNLPSIFHYGYKELVFVFAQNKNKNNTMSLNKEKHFYFLNVFHSLNIKYKKNIIIYKGFLDKYTWSFLNQFKILNEFSNNIFNSIIRESLEINIADNYFFVYNSQIELIFSFLKFYNLDPILNYNFDLMKNKTYYLNLIIKDIINNYKFIFYKEGQFYIYIKNIENINKYNNILKEYNLDNKFYFYKDYMIIPIFEFKSLIHLNDLKKFLTFLSKKDFVLNHNNPFYLKNYIKINIKKNNIFILFKNYIIDFNYQRLQENDIYKENILNLNQIHL